jgi:arylsulfatase A-like enzyme
MTGGFGKIINGQKNTFNPKNKKRDPITNGWDWLSVPLDESDYFASEFFEKRPNGSHWISSLGDVDEKVDTWYQTSQIGNRSFEFMNAAIAAKKPFVCYLGPHAPHYSADAPPWARDLFSDLGAPRTPAYNTSIGQLDKTQHVAQNPPFTDEAAHFIDVHFRDRWRAIVGVDDMIGLVVDFLDQKKILDDTYVFFSR